MKDVRITFNDPDSIRDAVDAIITDEVKAISGLSKKEAEGIIQSRSKEVREKLSKWIKKGQLLTVDFDLCKGTATISTADLH